MTAGDARLFVAVPVPPGLARALRDEARARVRGAGGWRVLPAESIHLTLRFLGDTPSDAVAGLCASLDEACSGVPRHALVLERFGVFPPRGRPRVLWAGPGEGAPPVEALAAGVERWARAHGFRSETRAFRPHVTVARARQGARGPATGPRPHEAVLPVTSIVLYRSHLGPSGARYEVLATSALDGTRKAG